MKRNRNKFRRNRFPSCRSYCVPTQALRLWQQVNLSEVRGKSPDLTMRQAAILLTVYLEPPPHTVRGLAARLGVTKPVITRALDTMGDAEAAVAPPRRERQAQRACEAHRRRCIIRRTPGRRRHRQGAGADHLTARDPRLHAYRPDLADERLRGEVDAARFVSGKRRAHRCRRRRHPQGAAPRRRAEHASALRRRRPRLRCRRRVGMDPGRAGRLCRLCCRCRADRTRGRADPCRRACRARSSIPVPI